MRPAPPSSLCYFYPRPPRGGRHTSCSVMLSSTTFLSTPSAGRATPSLCIQCTASANFYPRPPRGGRPSWPRSPRSRSWTFLSTPSAGRATSTLAATVTLASNFYPRPPRGGRPGRSAGGGAVQINFYPRPPRGGRLTVGDPSGPESVFLSTPSAGRATLACRCTSTAGRYFYPRPPRGGRRYAGCDLLNVRRISIHALRGEGDPR